MTVENSKLQGNDAILSEAKRQLQSGNRVEAVRALHSILDSDPTHKDALYYLAVSMRQQGDSVAARSTLQSLFAAHPDYGRAYQEEAYNLIALKRNDSALEAF